MTAVDVQSQSGQGSIRGNGRRIVIVGGGFGGAYCARALLRHARTKKLHVEVIDRNNYLLFYPLLVEAGTGHLEPRHVTVPIRAFIGSGNFRMAEVESIDLDRREVVCRSRVTGRRQVVPYDHLVLANGSITRLQEVPGLHEHGCEMKSLADAVALRDRAIALLEAANSETDTPRRRSLLHFVVVGANFTGAEIAGEYEMFLRRAIRRYPNLSADDYRVTLIEKDERILPAIDSDLARYARIHLEKRGIEVRLSTMVTRIGDSEVTLSDGDRLRARTVIWCAGIAPGQLTDRLDLPKDERGYILCDAGFRVRGHDDVWAIGDAAVNPDPGGGSYPPTAQHAVRQGLHLARNLVNALEGRSTEPLRYRSRGAVAALGCRFGVARIGGFKLAGFGAWWLYRTIYLLKMPGLSRKARVAIDWTLDLFFPPDYVQLGVHRKGEESSRAAR